MPAGAANPILDLNPIGRLADGSPRYSFHIGFPARGLRVLDQVHKTPAEAGAEGRAYIAEWKGSAWYSNLGDYLGVKAVAGGYQAVVVTYFSNT